MNRSQRMLRLLPSMLVLALVFAAAAGMRPQPARRTSALSCDSTLACLPPNDTFTMSRYWGVDQPFDPTTNVQVCSLRVQTAYNGVDAFRITAWDPARVRPDPTTVPLRLFAYDISALQYNHLKQDFGSRPLVFKRAGHLADPPGSHFALDFFGPSFLSGSEILYFDHAGPAGTPVACAYPLAAPSSRIALPGAHPVLSYGLCPGDAATQAFVLGQSVMTADALLDTVWYEIAQRFRVPSTLQLEWFEFAMDDPVASPYGAPAGIVQVADGGQALPAGAFPTVLAQAVFGLPPALPQWATHLDLDLHPVLVAGHDYWVLLRVSNSYSVRARSITGAESSDFQDAIGPLYGRARAGGAWAAIPARALSMRVIGELNGIVDAPQPPLAPGARLKLSLTPNPSRGVVFAAWSGGTGRASIDVLDARGRRIAGADLPAAASGRWLWSGVAADGHVAPPGLYFLRVRDGAGVSAVERVVVVR